VLGRWDGRVTRFLWFSFSGLSLSLQLLDLVLQLIILLLVSLDLFDDLFSKAGIEFLNERV
jgi:hypothetical protein